MTPEQSAALRVPFAPNQIGKLPKPKTKDAPKANCRECGGYHGLPAVHLDFVGHAVTTARLLDVDPEWTWEPLATGPNGEPLFVNGGLWIKLTVAGVTRIGYGDGASPKECIGDAIRNAAMRFGVALDLWAKEDLHAGDEKAGEPSTTPAPAQPEAGPQTASGDIPKKAAADQEVWDGRPESLTPLGRFLWLADQYAELVPDFGRAGTKRKANGKDDAWLNRQCAAFEKNIAERKAQLALDEKWPIPEPKAAA